MVSTRSASRSGTPAAVSHPVAAVPKTPSSRASKSATKAGANKAGAAFVHTPSTVLLAWLSISLPLVVWDTGYVLGRPYTMPGGWLHKPIWGPYDLYGRVDQVYGQKAWDANNGFTGAQSAMNVVETLLYCVYLFMWFSNAAVDPKAAGGKKVMKGRTAGKAVLVCYAAAIMTLSKTALYWLNEYYSSFDNIGHNDMQSLIFLWIVPNGAWLVLPAYIIYQLGGEIMNAIAVEPIKRS